MSAFNSPLGSNNAALQDDVPTGDQGEVQGAPSSSLNKTSQAQYPSLQDNNSTTLSNNDAAPPEPTHIPVSNQSTSASNTQPMHSDPPNPSVVTDADLRTFKYLQSLLPIILHRKNAAKIAVGHHLPLGSTAQSNLFYAAIMGQRAVQDVIWKGPAAGATRELALRRLAVQVEDLIMNHMGRCDVDDVLDDLSDKDGDVDEGDDGENGSDGSDGGEGDEGGAGGGDGQGKKRKNGDEDSDEENKPKKHKPNESDEGGDGTATHTTADSNVTGTESSETDAHGSEEVDMPESDIENDNDTDTALGDNLAEPGNAAASTSSAAEADAPEIGARKKTWYGLW